ncbi:MAG: D-Ala-D-Ala carboxypeptidase family metallohydrolase [Chthoniobacterales bacterium]|nr:D-Ala-D-Ala carboxypeptidase family metallohydrolase [Chthoniobacterales bacterium]
MGLLLVGSSCFAPHAKAESLSFFEKFFSKNYDRESSWNVSPDWIEAWGEEVQNYGNYLSRLHLKNVSVEQVIASHYKVRSGVRNTLPPKRLWKKIRSVLRVADRLAEELEEPVAEVISAYRSPAYNARCPGAVGNSYHLQNMALDLRFRSHPRIVANLARELRQRGFFQGGVGKYADFVHIDTRGKPADW